MPDKFLWVATRENDEVDCGLIDTKEQSEAYKLPGDKAFRIEPYLTAIPSGVAPSPIINEELLLKELVQVKHLYDPGDLFFYHKLFLCGIAKRKELLIEGIRLVPNSFLYQKFFRYVYAIYELSYLDNGVHITEDEFKQKLAETTKIKDDDKPATLSVFQMSYGSQSNVTDDEFKSAVKGITIKYKYKKYDEVILKSLKSRKDGNIDVAEKALQDYFNLFGNASETSRPMSMATQSGFALDDYDFGVKDNYQTFSFRLNEITGGGYKGETWVIAGSTSDGKTACAREMVYEPMKKGANILFISLEMPREEVCQQFQTRIAWDMGFTDLTLNKIRRRQLNAEELEKYKKVIEKTKEYKNLYIFEPDAKFTMGDLEREIDRMQSFVTLDIVVVDYLELIDPDQQYESYRIRVKEVMRKVRRLALKKNLWFLIPHQINREGRAKAEKRGEPCYQMSDLQETAGVEQNCVVMVWIYQDDNLRAKKRCKIGVSKNRNGRLDVTGWHIGTDFEHCRLFEDGMNFFDPYEVSKEEPIHDEVTEVMNSSKVW